MTNKVIKITPDWNIIEMTQEQAYAEQGDRVFDSVALLVPETWKHKKKFKLTLSFVDEAEDSDRFNYIGTQLFQKLKNERYVSNNTLMFEDIYIANENDKDIIDFTIKDIKYIFKQIKLDGC